MAKQFKHLKRLGIWIDSAKAYIMTMAVGNDVILEKVNSGVETHVRFEGEGKAQARFGMAFLDNQEKLQARQRNQRAAFYKKLVERMLDADYIYLFGPGRTRYGLKSQFEKENRFTGAVIAFETAGKLTANQLKEKTRNYYNGGDFKNHVT